MMSELPDHPAPVRRVLIVDDYESGARSIARFLISAGHEVAIAHDGAAAIRIAREFRPDLVLLDLALPDVNGREVARRLRAERLPMIVSMSGSDVEEEAALSPLDDFDEHLPKPINLDRLLAIVGDRLS